MSEESLELRSVVVSGILRLRLSMTFKMNYKLAHDVRLILLLRNYW